MITHCRGSSFRFIKATHRTHHHGNSSYHTTPSTETLPVTHLLLRIWNQLHL